MQNKLAALLLACTLVLATYQVVLLQPHAISSFVFTAAGDYGGNPHTQDVLSSVGASGSDFHIFLGDLSYGELAPESEWCAFVKTYLGRVKPVLISGNHESDGENGLIEHFVSCLPSRLPAHGSYAKEFYFDYPTTEKPLARFIFISPNLRFSNGETYEYTEGTAHRKWLEKSLVQAAERDIPWTVVSMHKDCLNLESKNCEISEDLMNFLIAQKVDLVLQGHSHNYERTRQLNCVTYRAFNETCIAQKDYHHYTEGKGTVIAIVGTGGADIRDTMINKEKGYFATWNGNSQSPEHGYIKVEVTDQALVAQFVNTALSINPFVQFTDQFTIERP